MLVLGIESSCDETAFALLEDGHKLIASQISSQQDKHNLYGGVVPELAARVHVESIGHLYKRFTLENNISSSQIDLIAVTQGPGLLGSLLVGAEFAKGLSLGLKRPIIQVDHVLSHVHGAFIEMKEPIFPAYAWVISGGHTHLFYMQDPVSYRLISQTIDDACGECFDKVAQILGLPYPGGAAIEQLAQNGDHTRFPMPKMMARRTSHELSYSGLKTAMVRLVSQIKQQNPSQIDDPQLRRDLAASFQHEALSQIIRKLKPHLKSHLPAKVVYVCGGVACNKTLRSMMQHLSQEIGGHLKIIFPKPSLCSDNAAMIACMGYYKAQHWIQRTKSSKPHKTLNALYSTSYAWQPYSRSQLPWHKIATHIPGLSEL